MDAQRYLGSDDGIRRLGEAQELVFKTTAASTQRLSESTNTFFTNLMKGNAQLSQAQIEVETARAKAAATASGGLERLTNTVVKGLVDYKESDDKAKATAAKLAQDKAEFDYRVKKDNLEREDKEIGKRIKWEEQQQDLLAAEDLNQLTLEYTRSNWAQGVQNFKKQAAERLAKYGVSAEGAAKLLDAINKTALTREEDVRVELDKKSVEISNKQADSTGYALQLGLRTDVARIKNMLPTEQAAPLLESIGQRLEKFLGEENGLDFNQKLTQVNKVLAEVNVAYGDKADAFAKYGSTLNALGKWYQGYSKAYAEYLVDNDMGKFNAAKDLLFAQTGKDYGDRMVKPLDQEKFQIEAMSLMNQKDSLTEQAQKRAGLSFDFGDGFTQWMTSSFVLNPESLARAAADPLMKDRDDVKQAIAAANQVLELRKDLASLGVQRALTNEELKRLDLTNVNYFASMTKDIAQAQRTNQQLQPLQLIGAAVINQYRNDPNTDPKALAAIDALAAGKQPSSVDYKALQGALANQSAAINSSKAAAVETYNARVQEVYNKHDRVIKLFGNQIPSDDVLKQFYQTGKQNFEGRLTDFKNTIQQAAPTGGTTNLTQTSNFVNAPGTGLGVSVRGGRFRVAPKTVAAVQSTNLRDGGTPFILPVEKGFRGLHSFDKGGFGGGYGARVQRGANKRHGGIDLPVQRGQKNIALVSGKVLYAGNYSGYGGTVDILGDDGYVYRYAHQQNFVKTGDRIEPGQAVGSPNLSGHNSGHHLHFEVRDYKAYSNPLPDGSGKFFFHGTIDPIKRLRELTQLAGTTVGTGSGQQTSGQAYMSAGIQNPFAKTNNRAVVLNGGIAVQNNLAQPIGGQTVPANTLFTAQRPASTGVQSFNLANSPRSSKPQDYGYSWLRNNPDLMNQLHATANRLQVPGYWIADIIAQESGNGRLAMSFHSRRGNRNFGLFGFGSDSGVANYSRLNPVQQVQAYEQYMLRNGWGRHLQRVQGNATLAQMWAMTRMGTGWRKEILNGRQPQTLRLNDTGKTFADEIRLLGNHVGREYAVPDGTRSQRANKNKAPRSNLRSNIGLGLADAETDIVYRG